MNDVLAYGDLVTYRYGLVEVRGTVAEIYGPANDRRVVLKLTPEISGWTVDRPTTTVVEIDRLHRVEAA